LRRKGSKIKVNEASGNAAGDRSLAATRFGSDAAASALPVSPGGHHAAILTLALDHCASLARIGLGIAGDRICCTQASPVRRTPFAYRDRSACGGASPRSG
jgi:hypothetical protein